MPDNAVTRGTARVKVSSPSRKSAMRRGARGSRRSAVSSARISVASGPAEAFRTPAFREARPPYGRPVRDPRRHRRSTTAARRRETPGGNRPSRGCGRPRRRSWPPRDRRLRRDRRAAAGTNARRATDPGSSAQCAPAGWGLERTGVRRAIRPKMENRRGDQADRNPPLDDRGHVVFRCDPRHAAAERHREEHDVHTAVGDAGKPRGTTRRRARRRAAEAPRGRGARAGPGCSRMISAAKAGPSQPVKAPTS